MAAALFTSLATCRSPSISPFPNPNRPHSSTPLVRISPFPLPRNPSSRISCSVADPQLLPHDASPHDLGATQRDRRSPILLEAEGKSKTLIKSGRRGFRGKKKKKKISKYENLWETGRTHMSKEFLDAAAATDPAIAIISCAAIIDDEEKEYGTLQFSTSDSDGVLLKQFSKPLISRKLFVESACRNLLLLDDQGSSFLCNIATQELITFPDIDDTSCQVMGFGYVPSTKEFKVLGKLNDLGLHFKVLTLGADQWLDVETPPLDYARHHKAAAFVNGAIHLLVGCGDNITTFNLETEEWGSITGPPAPAREYWTRPAMKELSGYLCMFNHTLHSSIDIWLLKDYNNNSWVKACTINLSYWDGLRSLEPLAIEDDGRILVQVGTEDLFELQVFSLQVYDPKTNNSREIHRFLFDKSVYCRRFYAKVFSSLWHR